MPLLKWIGGQSTSLPQVKSLNNFNISRLAVQQIRFLTSARQEQEGQCLRAQTHEAQGHQRVAQGPGVGAVQAQLR